MFGGQPAASPALPTCGCYYYPSQDNIQQSWSPRAPQYLPLIETHIQTTILSISSWTRLRQNFQNGSSQQLPDVEYLFPLYDGVSVVSFTCTIDEKTIIGVVKEKEAARAQYREAVSRGENAGLLEQSSQASDVFRLCIGNVPANQGVEIEIEYVGELKHDAELDGIRLTIPTIIAPRYGFKSSQWQSNFAERGKIEIVVDVKVQIGSEIEGLASPSHPIQVTTGRTHVASATLSLGSNHLDRDFVIVASSTAFHDSHVMIEHHPTIPGHQALMVTFVPKFNLEPLHPEIVFVVDRSGSMGDKMITVIESLKIFLKSLPLSVKFNLCSFGSSHSFLFKQSQPYDEQNLRHALDQVEHFQADFGGTELLQPIRKTVEQRLGGVPLEIMVLTDGQVWNQQELFDFVDSAARQDVRLFSLGIGTSTSSSLIEGLARAGNGFAQFAHTGEKIEKRVVRMLKAALSAHLTNCVLEVKYFEDGTDDESVPDDDDDYELVHAVSSPPPKSDVKTNPSPVPINFVDPNFIETPPNPPTGRYDHLPKIDLPSELQAPFKIPGPSPFSRTSAYILIPNSTRQIIWVNFEATCNGKHMRFGIPVEEVGIGQTIHQLAAKKAMLEIEEGRGWLPTADFSGGICLKTEYEADWPRIVEREAVRLGVQFQVAGKFCSFVALEHSAGKEGQIVSIDHGTEIVLPSGGFVQQHSSFGSTGTSFGGSSPFGGGARARFATPASHQAPTGQAGTAMNNTSASIFGGQSIDSRASESKKWAPPPFVPHSSMYRMTDVSQNPGFRRGSRGSRTQSQGRSLSEKPASGAAPSFGGPVPPPPQQRFQQEQRQQQQNLFSSIPRSSSYGNFNIQPTLTPLQIIIDRQQWSGNWTLEPAVFSVTGINHEKFTSTQLDSVNDDQIKATVMVLAWLEKFAQPDKEVWEMIADKARKFVVDRMVPAAAGGSDKMPTHVDKMVRDTIKLFFG